MKILELKKLLRKKENLHCTSIQKLRKEIEPFLFLFKKNTYTDCKRYEDLKNYSKGYYVNIYYSYSGGILNIETGVFNKHRNYDRVQDKNPDVEKIRKSFIETIEKEIKSEELQDEWLKEGIKILKQLKGE